MKLSGPLSTASMMALPALLVLSPVAADPTGDEIIQRCDHETYIGSDQRSTLTLIIRDVAGNEQRNVYQRYWKDNEGEDNIVDKMLLFTEFPPDAKGTAFMRWSYLPEEGKNADQWLYLPSLGTLRRVSVRDPGDSFLGSDLTYQDISYRPLDMDEHTLLREESRDGQAYYVVESIPQEGNPIYGRTVTWATRADDWADCNIERIEYYDRRDSQLKVQTLTWQQVDDAWIWDEVVVENRHTGGTSIFRITDVEVNVGLGDRMFSERTMRRGVR